MLHLEHRAVTKDLHFLALKKLLQAIIKQYVIVWMCHYINMLCKDFEEHRQGLVNDPGLGVCAIPVFSLPCSICTADAANATYLFSCNCASQYCGQEASQIWTANQGNTITAYPITAVVVLLFGKDQSTTWIDK